MLKHISVRLEAIISPARTELRLAQEQALQRIQQVIRKAENEIAREDRFLSAEQRIEKAIKELERAEEQLLSALGSIIKAIWYVAPQENPFLDIPPVKDINGTVVGEEDRHSPAKAKFDLFNWKRYTKRNSVA